MSKVDLGGGDWAVLRDPAEVKERDRRPVTLLAGKLTGTGFAATLKAAQDDDTATVTVEQLEIMSELNDRVAVALLESWSWDTPISVDSLLELPGGKYDLLRHETGKHFLALLPSFEPSPEPDSPSQPSQP